MRQVIYYYQRLYWHSDINRRIGWQSKWSIFFDLILLTSNLEFNSHHTLFSKKKRPKFSKVVFLLEKCVGQWSLGQISFLKCSSYQFAKNPIQNSSQLSHMTMGQGQKARGTRKNGQIKVAFLLGKLECIFSKKLWVFHCLRGRYKIQCCLKNEIHLTSLILGQHWTFRKAEWLNLQPLHVYYIQYSQYTQPRGRGPPRWAVGKYSITWSNAMCY